MTQEQLIELTLIRQELEKQRLERQMRENIIYYRGIINNLKKEQMLYRIDNTVLIFECECLIEDIEDAIDNLYDEYVEEY